MPRKNRNPQSTIYRTRWLKIFGANIKTPGRPVVMQCSVCSWRCYRDIIVRELACPVCIEQARRDFKSTKKVPYFEPGMTIAFAMDG